MSALERADQWCARNIGASVPVPDRWPARMRQLQRALAAAGWATGVAHGYDSADHAFLTLDAVEHGAGERKVRATWHTRATGGRTYRLFSAMVFRPWKGWSDVSVAGALAVTLTPVEPHTHPV